MLSESKNKAFIEFIKNSSKEEIIWMSGFLSGMIYSSGNLKKLRKFKEKITLVYGTETGNAKNLAFSIVRKAKNIDLQMNLISLDQYRLIDLKKENYFFIIISTHGEGEPPSSAKSFFNFIHQEEDLHLDNMKYSVLALGDRSYPFFCKAGENVDKRLHEVGASRLIPLHKCDVDYEEKAEEWFKNIFNFFEKEKFQEDIFKKNVKKKKIYGTILTNILLNDKERGSNKEIHHIEILIKNPEDVDYKPGDSMGIIAENPSEEVKKIMNHFQGKKDNDDIDISGSSNFLKKANIFNLSKNVLEKYSTLAKKDIPHDREWNLIDLLKSFPMKNRNQSKNLKEIVEILDPIKPRFYSISSSPRVHDSEIHITVSRHKFQINGNIRYGYCSDFLSKLKEGDILSFFIHKNYLFKLPESDKDIILIGPGTGIAPFRSFLYEREAMGASGRNWLFFGDQHFSSDFLYQTEIQNWKKNGVLYRVSLAFSRDQEEKIYVQNKIWENRKEFFTWIENGAYVYICGQKKPMSIDVENTIFRLIEEIGGTSPEFFIRKMKESGRYLKDVY
ncbi:diflavin oxidoreductase [Blattabacterium cuenoti]|uniref:diflavin oxidoreductase n=1 Tax=Blattabacterium cuenoti TaxID=1653831 RepID=UPI00163C5647|nr:flavodoxin domain-containing protein [Blattabacterium cuenoti]